jgi:hypothetical protein
MIFLGAIFGILAAAIVNSTIGARTFKYARKYARPPGLLGRMVLRRRAKAALLDNKVRMAWPLLIPLVPLNPLIFAAWAGPWGVEMMLSYVGAYVCANGFNYRNFVHETLRRFRQAIAVEVARVIVHRGDVEYARDVFLKAAAQDDPCHRLAAIFGLRELGTPEALALLEEMRKDADANVAAMANEAYEDLRQNLDPTHRPCPELPAYVLRKLHPDSEDDEERVRERNRVRAMGLLEEKELRNLLNAQLPLRRGHPHLFCHACWARAVHLREGEWDWVECRLCGNSGTLETDVKEVVGQVGGEYEWSLANGVLRLNLWDQERKKARAADIDVLEIVDGGGVDYDWAVSAVLEELERRGNAPGKQWHIRGGGLPMLQKNTLLLLKTADPNFWEVL